MRHEVDGLSPLRNPAILTDALIGSLRSIQRAKPAHSHVARVSLPASLVVRRSIRRQGSRVRREREHFFRSQMLYNRLHQFAAASGSRAMLEIVELADDVTGRTARDPGHVAKPSK